MQCCLRPSVQLRRGTDETMKNLNFVENSCWSAFEQNLALAGWQTAVLLEGTWFYKVRDHRSPTGENEVSQHASANLGK